MSRFVILNHDWPFLHWDLMLERDGALLTWRLLDQPAPEATIRGERLSDHRIDYLDYEGPVSLNRGTVERWDWGELKSLEHSGETWIAHICGNHINGRVEISQHAETNQTMILFGPEAVERELTS